MAEKIPISIRSKRSTDSYENFTRIFISGEAGYGLHQPAR